MRQAVPTPTPPAAPSLPQNLGEQLGNAARQIAQNAINEARQEIQSELTDAVQERQQIQAQLDAARSGSARRDLQRELNAADLKIEKLQEALASLESKTTAKVPRIGSFGKTFPGTTPPPSFPTTPLRVDPTEIVAVTLGILFVAFPLTLALSRFLWKRATGAPVSPALTQEQTRRFDRLEQSVDAIAIEVERISENQRYLTKLLAEPKQNASVGSGGMSS